MFFSLLRIAAFSALRRAASSAFLRFFASSNSFRRFFMSASRLLASLPLVAASLAFISLFSLRRCSASSALRSADSRAACSRAACVEPSRPSSVRGAAVLGSIRFLPRASSFAALYTPLNSSKPSTPFPSLSYALNMAAANSTGDVLRLSSSPRSSSSDMSSSIYDEAHGTGTLGGNSVRWSDRGWRTRGVRDDRATSRRAAAAVGIAAGMAVAFVRAHLNGVRVVDVVLSEDSTHLHLTLLRQRDLRLQI